MTMTRTRPMTVGELSRRTGVSVKNVRQYTDDGLINTIGRSPTGYRLYDTDALWCVQLIGDLRGLGLTIAEIRQLRTARCRGRRLAELLQASRARVAARITELHDTLDRIDAFEGARFE